MVTALSAFALPLAQVDVNRIPSGTGIDFLVWPVMVAAFFYIVYVLIRKTPEEQRNKEDKN